MYNAWPLGKLSKKHQRPEIDELRKFYETGDPKYFFDVDDPRDANRIFEYILSKYTGAPYVVLVDNCTDGLFLALKCFRNKTLSKQQEIYCRDIVIPARTYISVPMSIRQADYCERFVDYNWSGAYQLDPTPVWDAAARFTKNMYKPGTMMVLSFQIKKRIPIGKGGAILLDDEAAADWLRKMSFEGRNISKPYDEDPVEFMGYNMYMTPEDAARGVLLFNDITNYGKLELPDTMNQDNYTDLREYTVFDE